MMTGCLPNKVLQRVKRYLRRKARKPFDMNVKSYCINITRVNSEEILKLPPKFDETQSLAEDKIVDILLYGTPKSWQKEMDHQGFDPLGHAPMEVISFMERIDASEEFDSDKKTTEVATSNKGKKKSNDSNGSKGSHHDNGTISPVSQSTNQSCVPSSRPRADVRPEGKDTRSNPECKVEQKR